MTNEIIEQAAATHSATNQQPLTMVTKTLAAEMDQSRQALDVAVKWIAENGISFMVNLLVSVLLLVIGSLVIRMLTKTTQRALQRSGRVNNLLENFLCSFVSKTAWLLLFMVVIQRLGVNIAPLIAGLGVTGFIIGFAFQESLGNLASGMMIAVNHPFKVGDFVEIGGIMGTVQELNMMAATLATPDNKKIVIPNKIIWGSPITNFTDTSKRRMDIAIGISYDTDIAKARRVALEVLRAHPLVLKDPEPIAEVLSFGDSAVNMVLRPWATPADYWPALFELNRQVKEAFDKNGIAIPFPQIDVHMKS
ncbi:MAG: mechanosensitive ion channel family protein [Kiritimatiellae bacterium]|nr:mechanosensitive ion channel family protein [Kiritimatiellia bacterium]